MHTYIINIKKQVIYINQADKAAEQIEFLV